MQVCDNEWHHYSVHVKLPEVTLYVDGHIFRPENGESPEVGSIFIVLVLVVNIRLFLIVACHLY